LDIEKVHHLGYFFTPIWQNAGYDRNWLLSLLSSVQELDIAVLMDLDPRIAWTRQSEYKKPEMGKSDGLSGDSLELYCTYQQRISTELLGFAKEKSWLVIR
jgi:hypothetical protein